MKTLEKPKKFAHDLCEWYREHKRDLPFRKSKDPYKIFLSELMLQQTQIATMIPYYYRFIERFPDVQTLSKAQESEVLKYWEGLGYYSRARYVHHSAQQIVNEFNGEFPTDLKSIESLKGVGRYTSRAIHSIAFDQPSVAVDGNVMRVMSRVLLFDKDTRQTKNMRIIEDTLKNVIVHETPSDFTQALMEIGALVCKKKPHCEICPLKNHCFAYKQNVQENYPFTSKLKDKKTESYHVFILKNNQDVLLQQRDSKGLLANMYEFPQYEGTLKNAIDHFEKSFNVKITAHRKLTQIEHIFTHKIWKMSIHIVNVASKNHLTFENVDSTPNAISKAHIKIIEYLKEKDLLS